MGKSDSSKRKTLGDFLLNGGIQNKYFVASEQCCSKCARPNPVYQVVGFSIPLISQISVKYSPRDKDYYPESRLLATSYHDIEATREQIEKFDFESNFRKQAQRALDRAATRGLPFNHHN